MAADRDARIVGVMGASGSGKSLWLKALLRDERPARLVVWDFKDEHQEACGERPGAKCKTTLEDVRRAMIAAGTGPLRIRYKPRTISGGDKALRREFETLCSMVQAWEDCCFLVEELSNVTQPGWAPPAWRMMTTGGRHEGIFIIGTSQSPALIDKTFLSNCTLIHVGQLHEHAHRNAVEKSLDVEPYALADLVQFQWIEKHRKTGEFITGIAPIPKGCRAPPAPPIPARRGRGASSSARGDAKPLQLVGGTAKLQPSPPSTTALKGRSK